MGWSSNIFQLLIVVSGPNATGLFVYNGAPAKGNLVAQIVAPGVTSDPFGNAVNAVANFGKWNAAGTLLQHFGIDANGFTYLANSSGNTVILEQSTDGSELFYTSAGIAAGNLRNSISPVTGTDTSGNTYQPGIVNYSGITSAIAQLLNGLLNVGTAAQLAGTGGATPGQVGLVTANPGVVRMDSGLTATGDSDAFVDVRSKNAQSAISAVAQRNVTLAGPLALSVEGSTPAVLTAAMAYSGSGHAQVLSGTTGDSNTYDTERLTLLLGAAFTITTTTAAIFSKPLGLGKYVVDVWLVTSNTIAADPATYLFGFTGTAVSPVLVDFESKTSGTSTVGYLASSSLIAGFTAQAVAGNQQLLAHLTLNVSVAGTLTLNATTPASTVSVFAGSRMQIRPVVAS